MTKKPRYLRGLLIAPLAVIPALLASMLLMMLIEMHGGSNSSNTDDYMAVLAALAYLAAFASVVSYSVTAVLGVPAYMILLKFGKATLPNCIVIGGLLGALLGTVFILMPIFMIVTTLCGASVAGAFCVIAGRQGRGSGLNLL